MTIIFQSRKTQQKIFFYKIRLIMIPSLILMFGFGIQNGFGYSFWLRTVPIILLTWGLGSFLRVFYTFRYYIMTMQITENDIEIVYYRYGRQKNILLNKNEIYFRLNDFKGKSKYFEIVKGDLLIIKQAPYLEWEENLLIKKRLEDNGFKFRTYW